MVVQPQPHAQHPARRRCGSHGSTKRSGWTRWGACRRTTAFAQRLAHQAELALFQVAQAAVDQFAAGTGGVRGQVVLFAQHHAQATATGVTGDAGAIDAATDHQQVDVVHRVSASRVCRAEPMLGCRPKVEHGSTLQKAVGHGSTLQNAGDGTTTGPEGPVALHQ
jgi:hypothetical protein